MGTFIDVTGRKFGMLLVLNLHPEKNSSNKLQWNCLCDCGTKALVSGNRLQQGQISCGCQQQAGSMKNLIRATEAVTTHGMCHSAEYSSWIHMIQRCTKPNHHSYKNYGGRGIMVCERWLKSFENFLADMGRMPEPRFTLDRIDVNRGYEPENVRWLSLSENSANTRRNRFIETPDGPMRLIEASRKSGLNVSTLIYRSKNWPVEHLFKPPHYKQKDQPNDKAKIKKNHRKAGRS